MTELTVHTIQSSVTLRTNQAPLVSFHRDFQRGDIKIFDFGLARELRESDRDPDNEGMFRLSNMTGSFRYMAPEVGIDGTPYNSKA